MTAKGSNIAGSSQCNDLLRRARLRTPSPNDLNPSADLIAYDRRVLTLHTTNPGSGVCPVCGVTRCPDWLDAFDRLAAAGELMTSSPLWEPFVPGYRPKYSLL